TIGTAPFNFLTPAPLPLYNAIPLTFSHAPSILLKTWLISKCAFFIIYFEYIREIPFMSKCGTYTY
ncbi:hypothetical protein JW964_29155, partial [candidate division KSB1 bacterium]|nr:hypothetical protein [candidate division KSB1 bacterium]